MLMLKNGQPCDVIKAQDRAFLYGDGFFTSIKIQHSQPVLWIWHVQRLKQCALQLGFDINLADIESQAKQLLSSCAIAIGVLKIIISRGQGSRGYLPPTQSSDVYLQLFVDEQGYDGHLNWFEPASLQTRAIESGLLNLSLGHVMPQLAGLKTLNRLEQVLLRQELQGTGWAEALVTDIQGNIIEGVYSNCFFYQEGKWCTPRLEQAGIAGVMRAALLHAMEKNAIDYVIMHFPRAGVASIDAMFFCNALSGIVPVKHLQGRTLTINPVLDLAQVVASTVL